MEAARRGVGFLILGLVTLQFFLAGIGVFGAGGFGAHSAVGYVALLAALVLAGLVAASGDRAALRPALILLGFLVLQPILANLRDPAPIIAALHPLTAVGALYVAHQVARGLPLGGGPAADPPRAGSPRTRAPR